MAFESYPQLIMGLFIWQGLQIKEPLNIASISISAASAIYGFGDLLAFHVNSREARAPFKFTIFGMLATSLDTLLRAVFMAYMFSIVKYFAWLVLPVYFVFMMMAMCVRKKKCSIDKYEIFGIIMSFGCSAAETEMTSYNLRPISKAVFFVIFVPCLLFLSYTTAFMPNVGFGEITNGTTLESLHPSHCLDLCGKDELTINYCGSLWRYFEDESSIEVNQMSPFTDSSIGLTFPQTHGVILIVLSSLFLLSVIEGLLESWIPLSPYQLLYKTTEDLSFDDKKIKMLTRKQENLTETLANQKKSSENKIKELQNNYLKNTILNVTLKNDALNCQNDCQGTYEISDIVNDKPSWIFHENKKAIWYDFKNKNWSFGPLKNIGTSTKSLASIGKGELDPHNVPNSKWKYYDSKKRIWKEVYKAGDVTIENGGKEAFIHFINEKAAKHSLLKEKAFKSLTVTLKNDVFKDQKLCEGQYELGDIVIGKPSWVSYKNKQAIWYDGEKWRIGNAEDIGLEYTIGRISSFENEYPDPTSVPSDKWKYYKDNRLKDKAWKEVGTNDIVIEGKGNTLLVSISKSLFT